MTFLIGAVVGGMVAVAVLAMRLGYQQGKREDRMARECGDAHDAWLATKHRGDA